MHFGFITTAECVNGQGGTTGPGGTTTDPRCSDPAFALANPDICPLTTRLVIKPSVALTCALGSIQFRAFTITGTVETDVTAECVFGTSNMDIAVIGAVSGNATGLSQGEVTISATRNSQTATAELSVMGTSGDCCSAEQVAMMLVVDNSRSMSQTFGSSLYSTRLDFAKAAASRFISEVNESKDTVGLISFNLASKLDLSPITTPGSDLETLADNITQTQQKTAFYDALNDAITQLNASAANLKAIVLMSDGEDTSDGAANGYEGADNPITLLSNFKAAGGIVICLGCRASNGGFALLNAFATGGFFINAYPGTESDALEYLSGLKGYICAGNCAPTGDEMVATAQLNYDGFINWNVTGSTVDLQGNGMFDWMPGHGLYVDLSGSGHTSPGLGRMVSKTAFALTAGHTYRLTAWLAANPIKSGGPYSARLQVFYMAGSTEMPILSQLAVVNGAASDFTAYSYSFTAPADVDAYISIQEVAIPWSTSPSCDYGMYLDKVKFDDITDNTNLLTDDFDSENLQYVPPRCGLGTTFISGGYVTGTNCYGTGCLTTPPPAQLPDPNPLPAIELGYTPPTEVTSTQTKCASCDTGYVNLNSTPLAATILDHQPTGGDPNPAPLIPTMTSNTAPSGVVTSSNGSATAYQAFVNQCGWTDANSVNLPLWLQYQFSSQVTVSKYVRYYIAGCNPQATVPLEFLFQGSNDGLTWTTLDHCTDDGSAHFSGSAQSFESPVAAPQAFSYYRFYVLNFGGVGSTPCTFPLVALFGVASTVLPDYFTQLTYDLGSAKNVLAYDLTVTYANAPTGGWIVAASNDLVSWTTIATVYAPPFVSYSGTSQTFKFPLMSGTAYRYYRFAVNPRSDAVPTGFNVIAFYAAGAIQECATAQGTGSTQSAADSAASAAALLLAQAKLTCVRLFSSTEVYTAHCPAIGCGGPDVQRSGTGYSFWTQANADSEATGAAKALAEAALVCNQSTNEQVISIPSSASTTGEGPSSPYPSVKCVSSDLAAIANVSVSIKGFSHQSLDDVEIILIGPDGTAVYLMQFGPTFLMNQIVVSNIDIVFDDAGVAFQAGVAPVSGTTYRPHADLPTGTESRFPAPYPGPDAPNTTLASFIGKDPNGAWSLWIVDTQPLLTGSIARGWDLTIS